MSSLAHRLAMGIAALYEQRTPHLPLPAPPPLVVYVNPVDVALIAEHGARYLTAGARLIASNHVPAGWAHTTNDTVRADLDRLLLGHYTALGLAR